MPARSVITGSLGALIEKMGGVDLFAAHLGVWPHTVWRWGTARTEPSDDMKKTINALARAKKLRVPFRRRRA